MNHSIVSKDYLSILTKAVRERDINLIKSLARVDSVLNIKVLQHISKNMQIENKDILLALINIAYDVNEIISDEDDTILMQAASSGILPVVKALVGLGANVNFLSKERSFALFNAAYEFHQDVFDYLAPFTKLELRQEAQEILEKSVIKKNKYNEFEEEFITAAAMGDLDTVENCIRAGVNINAVGEDEVTGLYLAASWGHLLVVSKLIEAGANLEIGRESDGETPLIASAGNAPILSNQNSAKCLEQLNVIQVLIQAGANVNATTTEGWNAIEAAANTGNIEAVTLLIKAGADVNVEDNRGDTALSRALEAGYTDIVQILIESGAIGN